jgi:hypothetical protein
MGSTSRSDEYWRWNAVKISRSRVSESPPPDPLAVVLATKEMAVFKEIGLQALYILFLHNSIYFIEFIYVNSLAKTRNPKF